MTGDEGEDMLGTLALAAHLTLAETMEPAPVPSSSYRVEEGTDDIEEWVREEGQ